MTWPQKKSPHWYRDAMHLRRIQEVAHRKNTPLGKCRTRAAENKPNKSLHIGEDPAGSATTISPAISTAARAPEHPIPPPAGLSIHYHRLEGNPSNCKRNDSGHFTHQTAASGDSPPHSNPSQWDIQGVSPGLDNVVERKLKLLGIESGLLGPSYERATRESGLSSTMRV